tara:strand:+ start:2394 stop:2747 length:354 start_codon:yes stop_codon:yes gene_type:complete
MTLTTYYHATPYENLHSIMGEGIRRSWGGVYCSTVMETSAKWICFTRPQSKKIVVLPFKRLKSQMDYGSDHSPMLTKMMGVDDVSASFVCAEGIPASDIVWEDVRVFENPFFAGVEQ